MEEIRKISAEHVANTVCALVLEATHQLPNDVLLSIKKAASLGGTSLEKSVLMKLIENANAAREMGIPICQDTGMAVVFADVGEFIHIEGSTLEEAVNEGVRRAYVEGGLRLSVVNDPLFDRKNTLTNTPAILHIRAVKGHELHLTVAPKGFGSENMSRLRMFTPSATADDIVSFVVDGVQKAGSNPCPPIVVGVGIGADFEGVALLAKRALLRPLHDEHADMRYATLEKRIFDEINTLGIGPQGFGGKTTALAVKIEVAPTHIAGLPVAMNINCHVARHAEARI